MQKQNCWEAKQCGREEKGFKSSELGICPASTEKKMDGVHGGKNAGRCCWVVAGTLCSGETHGTFAKKFGACEKCDFYHQVKREEYPKFHLAVVLMKKLAE
jgi:hypothetical protein